MARDIVFSRADYGGSKPLYFVAYNVAELKWLRGSVTETYAAANWTSYANPLTLDSTTQEYYASFPQVGNGSYFVTIHERAGATPATTDASLAEGVFEWNGFATLPQGNSNFAEQVVLDASAFINEFAEDVTYTPDGGVGKQIKAIVDRSLPDGVNEDGKALTDVIEVFIHNDPALGISAIGVGRDTVTVSGRFGGGARPHLVTAVINSDAAVHRLRLR